MMYCGPYSDNLSTFTLLKQIAQIPQNLLLARVNPCGSLARSPTERVNSMKSRAWAHGETKEGI